MHNNNFIGIASYNIFVGVYVATIFGSAFFFDLFWPERQESRAVKLAWRICSVLACVFTLASALAFTVILSTRSAFIEAADSGDAWKALTEHGGSSPLKYRYNKRGIASVVFLWLGVVSTIASTILMWHCLRHIDKFGPKSTHARVRDDVKTGEEGDDQALEKNAESLSASTGTAATVANNTDGATSPVRSVTPGLLQVPVSAQEHAAAAALAEQSEQSRPDRKSVV